MRATRTRRQEVDTENTPILRRPASDGRWELALGGNNLTDDRYATYGIANVAGGVTVGVYNPPREWWLALRSGP